MLAERARHPPTQRQMREPAGRQSALHLQSPPQVGESRESREGTEKNEKDMETLVQQLGPIIVQSQVRGAFVCLAAIFLCRVNYELWIDYAGMALWAFILSEALKAGRDYYVSKMQELVEHLSDKRDISVHT